MAEDGLKCQLEQGDKVRKQRVQYIDKLPSCWNNILNKLLTTGKTVGGTTVFNLLQGCISTRFIQS